MSDATDRRLPGRPRIPRDRIVETALEILDREGADALSMRALAEQLGSGTATLYRHFPSRADLVACIVDRVFGEIDGELARDRASSWQDRFRQLANAMFRTFCKRRGLAQLLGEQVPMGGNAMIHRERVLGVLLDNGFSPAMAAKSHALLSRYVLGFAMQVEGSREATKNASLFGKVDASRFPITVRVARFLPVPLDEEFEFGLKLIVRGLEDLREEVKATRTKLGTK